MKRIAFILLAVLAAIGFLEAQTEKIDYATIGRIRDEGLSRSQVMDHVSWLSDVYGPRLTGSPAIQQASEWAMKKFGDWGLTNVHQERWKFGKGWSLVRFSAHLIEPQVQPLIGFPIEWSAGTKGTVTADVVRAFAETHPQVRLAERLLQQVVPTHLRAVVRTLANLARDAPPELQVGGLSVPARGEPGPDAKGLDVGGRRIRRGDANEVRLAPVAARRVCAVQLE